jgi:hypothetical protein
MRLNLAWSVSLESYHQHLLSQKVSKIPKIECIHNSLPRNEKSHFGSLRTLGVKRGFTKNEDGNGNRQPNNFRDSFNP